MRHFRWKLILFFRRLLEFAIVLGLIAELRTDAARAEKIRTAIPQANLNYLSVFVADARGFFREENLDNETVVISGPLSIDALLSGGTSTTAVPAEAVCAPRSRVRL